MVLYRIKICQSESNCYALFLKGLLISIFEEVNENWTE